MRQLFLTHRRFCQFKYEFERVFFFSSFLLRPAAMSPIWHVSLTSELWVWTSWHMAARHHVWIQSKLQNLLLFYDGRCRSESGALGVILAPGIRASAFMPLLVEDVRESIQIIHQCDTLIGLKIIKQQKELPDNTAKWMSLNGKVILTSFQKSPK